MIKKICNELKCAAGPAASTVKISLSSGNGRKQNLYWMFKITNERSVPNDFGKNCIGAE